MQGSTIYVFDRKNMTVTPAGVQSVSSPHLSKAAQSNPMSAFQGLVTDVAITIGGESTSFEFPVNSLSASYAERGWFVSPDITSIKREVDSVVGMAEQYFAQAPVQKEILEKGKALQVQLNPEKQQESQTAKEVADMRNEVAEMKAMLSAILGKKKKEE